MNLIKKILKSIFKFLTSDWKVKLAAVLIAFTLWAVVSANEQRINLLPYEFPVEIRNVNENYSASVNVDKVKIRVASDRSTFQQITSDKIRVYVDLAAKQKGTYDMSVEASSTLSNVEIVDITPATILVTVEELVQKEVLVQVVLEGTVASGKNVASTTPEITIATVKGPKAQINQIKEVRGLIKLNNQSQDFSEKVTLLAIDNQNNPVSTIKTIPDSTNVIVKVIDLENIKSVPIKISTSGKVSSGHYISEDLKAEPAIVNITGEPTRLKTINSINTETININGLNQTTIELVNLIIPNGISIEHDISKVNVTITLQRADISRDITVPVIVSNLASDKKVTSIDPQTVTISISGDQNIVNSVKSSDFSLVIDMSNASIGSFDKDINNNDIKTPLGITVLNILPSKIRLIVDKL